MDDTIPPENYLDTIKAAKITPGCPDACVIWRWMARGIIDRKSGNRIVLQHKRVGGKLLTTKEWIDAFIAETSRIGAAPPPERPRSTSKTIKRPTPARRARAIANARLALSRS